MLEVHRESGGFTPWNVCPVKCFFLFHWGSLPSSGFRPRNSEMHHTLCAILYALFRVPDSVLVIRKCAMPFTSCTMLAIPLGLGNALSRYPTKLHQLKRRVELFCFARGSPILQ